MHVFPRATLTNYYMLGGSELQKLVLLQRWRPGAPHEGAHMAVGPPEALRGSPSSRLLASGAPGDAQRTLVCRCISAVTASIPLVRSPLCLLLRLLQGQVPLGLGHT